MKKSKKHSLYNILFEELTEGEVNALGGDGLIQLINQDAAAWKEKNQDKYESMPVENNPLNPSGDSEEKSYAVPLKLALNLKSKDIQNGAILLLLLNINKQSSLPDRLNQQFNFQTRTFNEQTLSGYLNALNSAKLNVIAIFAKLSDNRSALGAMYGKLYGNEMIMKIDPLAKPEENISTIRHELQHGTQNINSLALAYARALKNPKITNLSQIKRIDIGRDTGGRNYGTGSQLTGLRQHDANSLDAYQQKVSSDPASDEGLKNYITSVKNSNDPEIKNQIAYLGDDFEYTTWKSDFLDGIMNNFVERNYNNIFYQKFLDINGQKISANLSKPSEYSKLSPENRKIVQGFNQDRYSLKENLNVSSRRATSLADLANLIIKDVTVVGQADNLSGVGGADNFINTIMKLKPKEFIKNLATDLTKRLVDYANQKGFSAAAAADTTVAQQRGPGQQSATKQQAALARQQQQAAIQQQQAAIQQQKIATANAQAQQEQQFRTEMNIVPRNPRKHHPEDGFDEMTGQQIVDWQQYRQQYQQWLQARQQTQPTIAESNIKQLINYLLN